MISQSVSNPHLYVNYTVDDDAFNQDVGTVRENIVYNGILDIFDRQMTLTPLTHAVWYYDENLVLQTKWVTDPICGQFASPQDVQDRLGWGLPLPEDWDTVRGLHSSIRSLIYVAALEGCAQPESEIAALNQQFDAYRDEAFARHSVVDFRSIEFRFTTAAPVNWNEVELNITVSPIFDGAVYPPQMSMVEGFSEMVAEVAYTFKAGEYIIRSQADSLNHVLELSTQNRDDFRGQTTMGYIAVGLSRPLPLVSVGNFVMYDRSLQAGDSAGEEYVLQQGVLLEEGVITTLQSSRPPGNSNTDHLIHNGREWE